jgi:uncharacterized protein (TIGR03067 family)
MDAFILCGLALTVGAPEPKEISILGEWIVVKTIVGNFDATPGKGEEIRFEFLRDGKLLITQGNMKPNENKYKLDLKKTPIELDTLWPLQGDDAWTYGIVKIEGDVLTYCFVSGDKNNRPKKFESTEDKPTTVHTLKRVKK